MPIRFALAALVLLLLAFPAFWPDYFARLRGMDGYTHLHAATGFLWLLLLIGQPLAIRAGNRVLHRRVGLASPWLAMAFALSGILLSHSKVAAMDAERFATHGFGAYLAIATSLQFSVAYLLGWYHRRFTPLHARFMAATGLLLIDPVLARLLYFYFPALPHDGLYQGLSYLITDALWLLLLVSAPRGGQARIWLGGFLLFMLLMQVGWFVHAPGETWLRWVDVFRGWPLT